jgi:hypothetical protein
MGATILQTPKRMTNAITGVRLTQTANAEATNAICEERDYGNSFSVYANRALGNGSGPSGVWWLEYELAAAGTVRRGS